MPDITRHHSSLISIVVPIYNSEAYICNCLDALLKQTLSEIEILCINDGSTDNSLAILGTYAEKDPRVKVFSQSNCGVASARNVGLKNATSPYLMFCDSDDWYEPTMCEEMLASIRTHNVDFVMCDIAVISKEESHYRDLSSLHYFQLKQLGKIDFSNHTKSSIKVEIWNKIFRMDLIKQYCIVFPNVAWGEDASFLHQYLSVSKNCYGLDKKLYNYSLRGNSLMGSLLSNKSNNKYDVFHAFGFTLNFLINNNLLNDNIYFIDVLNKEFQYWLKFIAPQERIQALKLISNCLELNASQLNSHPFLYLCKQKKYTEALAFYNSHGSTKYKLIGLSLFERKSSSNKIRYYFLGVQVFKKSIIEAKIIFHVLGVKICSYNIASPPLSHDHLTGLMLI